MIYLRPLYSRERNVRGAIIAIILWNAISVFMWPRTTLSRDLLAAPLPEYLLFIPYALIGIFLFTLLPKELLTLLAPRVMIVVDEPHLTTGKLSKGGWELSKGVTKATSLKVSLCAVEFLELHSHDGGTSTLFHEAWELPLLNHTSGPLPSQGVFNFTIPLDAMPSTRTARAGLTWRFCTKLEVFGLPSIEEHFVVIVHGGV